MMIMESMNLKRNNYIENKIKIKHAIARIAKI